MQREIGVVLLMDDHDRGNATHQGIADLHPNYLVAKALGERIGKRDGIIVGGCGMDMGFHVVYNLGRVLWPDGFGCIGKDCRSNDHSNGDRDRKPHGYQGDPRPTQRKLPDGGDSSAYEHWHQDGGYALNHRWL